MCGPRSPFGNYCGSHWARHVVYHRHLNTRPGDSCLGSPPGSGPVVSGPASLPPGFLAPPRLDPRSRPWGHARPTAVRTCRVFPFRPKPLQRPFLVNPPHTSPPLLRGPGACLPFPFSVLTGVPLTGAARRRGFPVMLPEGYGSSPGRPWGSERKGRFIRELLSGRPGSLRARAEDTPRVGALPLAFSSRLRLIWPRFTPGQTS